MLSTFLLGYCVLCYGGAALFMATEAFGFYRPITFREAAYIVTAIALAPVTVPAAVLFACLMSLINLGH